jgi:SAM-dependent methyltransferase
MGAANPRVAERVWQKRSGEAWIDTYWSDDRSPRRDHIIEALRTTFQSPASVLDIGCNAAPNLRRIAAEFPECRLIGFDINRDAITSAARRFAEAGIAADLSVGSYYEVLPTIRDASIDVVISSYALAYVPPQNLHGVLSDIVRIAWIGVVLAEPQAFGGARVAGMLTAPWYDWRHDYAEALRQIGVPPERIAVHDLPTPGAQDSGLVVVDLRTSGDSQLE